MLVQAKEVGLGLVGVVSGQEQEALQLGEEWVGALVLGLECGQLDACRNGLCPRLI